jgi:hypothetical protein
MRKIEMKKILIVLCVIVVLILGFLYARRVSPIFNFLFPPSDKFVPLAAAKLDLAKQGLKVELPFRPKYPGGHRLDLEVQKYDPEIPFKGKFLLNVCIKDQNKHAVINRTVSGPVTSFWGNEKKGFTLLSFVVPGQIGLGENGAVEIIILTPDADFAKTYGDAKFVINKDSDE